MQAFSFQPVGNESGIFHQIPSLPGSKRRQMPGVYPGGGGCLSFDLTDTLLALLKIISLKQEILFTRLSYYQGRSQDFSVGTHSFPSHLFTPPPPPKKKIKVIFDSRVFYFKSRAQES